MSITVITWLQACGEVDRPIQAHMWTPSAATAATARDLKPVQPVRPADAAALWLATGSATHDTTRSTFKCAQTPSSPVISSAPASSLPQMHALVAHAC